MIKQCYWYGVVYIFHQRRFTCHSNAWKKYVGWFIILPIIFYIIFGPCMNHIDYFLCFEFKEFIMSVTSSSGNICGLKLGIAEVFLCFYVFWIIFIGIICPWCFIIFFFFGSIGLWLLIEFSLNWENADQLNQNTVHTLFCSCLQHPGLLALAACFDIMEHKLIKHCMISKCFWK